MIDDDLMDKLGTYYVYFRIRERYGITFERFLEKWSEGTWEAYLAA